MQSCTQQRQQEILLQFETGPKSDTKSSSRLEEDCKSEKRQIFRMVSPPHKVVVVWRSRSPKRLCAQCASLNAYFPDGKKELKQLLVWYSLRLGLTFKNVSESVSNKFGLENRSWYRYRSDFGSHQTLFGMILYDAAFDANFANGKKVLAAAWYGAVRHGVVVMWYSMI